MRKLLLLLLFFICICFTCYSQDIFPANSIVEMKKHNDAMRYSGAVLKLDNHDLLRARVYDDNHIQLTYIRRNADFDFRTYVYFDITNGELTPALSIRYYIKKTKHMKKKFRKESFL